LPVIIIPQMVDTHEGNQPRRVMHILGRVR
jgi:hypothetical protein